MMAHDRLAVLVLPHDLDDRSVAALQMFFIDALAAIEDRYADQLHRHYQPPEPPALDQYDLWDDDPPF